MGCRLRWTWGLCAWVLTWTTSTWTTPTPRRSSLSTGSRRSRPDGSLHRQPRIQALLSQHDGLETASSTANIERAGRSVHASLNLGPHLRCVVVTRFKSVLWLLEAVCCEHQRPVERNCCRSGCCPYLRMWCTCIMCWPSWPEVLRDCFLACTVYVTFM